MLQLPAVERFTLRIFTLTVTLHTCRELLGCATPHLCKSIIVENVACTNSGVEDPLNSRYVSWTQWL